MEELLHLLRRFTSAHMLAVIALFVALSGTAGANGIAWITGRDVLDHSLSGRDIKRHSLGGKTLQRNSVGAFHLRNGSVGSAEVKNGSLRARDFHDGHLPGLRRTTTTAPAIPNYVNLDPIVSTTTERGGNFIATVRFRVTNTGASGEYLNCGFRANGILYAAAGADTTAGQTTRAFSVTVVQAKASQQIEFACQGGGGTTYDLSHIRMYTFRLG